MYRQRFKCEREIVWYKQKGKLKLGIIKKTIYDKITVNIILNCEKWKAFALKSGTSKGAHSHHYHST